MTEGSPTGGSRTPDVPDAAAATDATDGHDAADAADVAATSVTAAARDDAGAVGAPGHPVTLEHVLGTVPVAVTVVDTSGRITYANGQAETVLGLRPGGVTGRTYDDPAWEITDVDGGPYPAERLPVAQVLRTGAPVEDVRHAIVWPDGTRRVVSVNSTPIRDDGAVTGVVSAVVDVTDEHERRRELERARHRDRSLIESAPDAVIVAEAETGVVVEANRRATDLLGRDRAELIGLHQSELHPPAERDRYAREFESEANGAGPTPSFVSGRPRVRTADGEDVPVDISAEPVVVDGVECLIGHFRDARRRERYERALVALYRATRTVVASDDAETARIRATDALSAALDLEAVVLYERDPEAERLVATAANDAARAWFGDDPPAVTPAWEPGWRAYERGEVVVTDGESPGPFVDGSVGSAMLLPVGDRGVLVVAAAGADAHDAVDEAVGSLFALSLASVLERVDSESAVAAQTERLARQNEHLDEFASVVAHDVRSPLAVARGNLQLAAESGDPARFERVDSSLDRIESLVRSVRSFARSGGVVQDPSPVDLQAVAASAWGMVETGDATLRVESTPECRGDEAKLTQVFENLFRNAVEHGGPAVTVTVRGRDDGRGFVVEDDGPGVPPDRRDLVFDRGYTGRRGSTGYGLAIVDAIARGHGWTVSVGESESGGARFDVTFEESPRGE